MKPHSQSANLTKWIKAKLVPLISWKGEVFRATSVRYANRDDLITGQGAKLHGGRWNAPLSFATVYTSTTPETALAEYLAQHRFFGWPVTSAMPYVMVGIEVKISRLLDLTDNSVQEALHLTDRRLLNHSWRTMSPVESLSQALGRIAFDNEIEAMLVPSAALQNSKNLVVFPGNLLAPDSWLRIINRSLLPPLPSEDLSANLQ